MLCKANAHQLIDFDLSMPCAFVRNEQADRPSDDDWEEYG